MSARASIRLRQSARSARCYAQRRQASTEPARPGSWNSAIVGGSLGLAVMGAAALATKYGVSEKRQEAFSKMGQKRAQPSEPSLKKSNVSELQNSETGTDTSSAAAAATSAAGTEGTITETQAEAGAEQEQSQQAAFNPETGEINWDCPCLGGMADGPCGPEFKDAFSCFVFSDQEPKGIDCVEKFKGMQECFRRHPDVYERELQGLDDDEEPPSDSDSVTTVSTPDSDAASSSGSGPASPQQQKPEDSYVEVSKEEAAPASQDKSS